MSGFKNPPLDWRSILAPVVTLTREEAETMDELARTRPEMVKLICQRMRLAADRHIAQHGSEPFNGD